MPVFCWLSKVSKQHGIRGWPTVSSVFHPLTMSATIAPHIFVSGLTTAQRWVSGSPCAIYRVGMIRNARWPLLAVYGPCILTLTALLSFPDATSPCLIPPDVTLGRRSFRREPFAKPGFCRAVLRTLHFVFVVSPRNLLTLNPSKGCFDYPYVVN